MRTLRYYLLIDNETVDIIDRVLGLHPSIRILQDVEVAIVRPSIEEDIWVGRR